jgi:hypothetical protein
VDHAPDARVAWPDSLELGPFQVLEAGLLPPAAQGELTRSTAVLVLTAFELGDLEIPSFEVEVVGPGEGITTLDTNPFGIRVESVGLDESGDIRELKGPLWIPVNAGRVALWGLALLAAGVLAWLLYRRLRRRQAPEDFRGSGPALPYRPPHEVALEALAELESSPLLERGEVKEYHIRVSDILRSYVEGRWQVPALEMTTRDITSGLTREGVAVSVVDEFRRFLDRCDMVKFAKHRPDDDSSLEVLSVGRRLVEETASAGPAAFTEEDL